METEQLKRILEALIMASSTPLSMDRMLAVFPEDQQPEHETLREALTALAQDYAGTSLELKEVSTGYRFQVRKDYAEWVGKLWEEKPARYSRALLETLALVAYKQPITRGEIEKIRGVSVNTQIMKTLLEREWVTIVGHRDVPGKPAIYATTKQFLDYFNLKSLADLPPLAEIRDLDQLNGELAFPAAEDEDDAEANANTEGEASDTVVNLDVEAAESEDADMGQAMTAEH
ncbi:MAG: SMC-Scp complex subunit ScpB [Gammaproteobacteria bacterium]|nr:SMC-Scp complex subunit ScpB [Gammaproteobacteria bacterium]